MRLIHSSDLQIGKVFMYFEPEVAVLLQDARQAAVRTLGDLAMKHGASTVLLAGDIYDKQQLSPQTLAKPIEGMRQFPKVTWHLMPGNHDHVRENGLWDRLSRTNLPENVQLHTSPGAVKIMDDDGTPVCLLPAPLPHIANVEDLTGYMDKEATPEGAIRIGMAHGSIQGFGSDGEASNYVEPTRADTAGLAYLAMGHWHRQVQINDRVWYSGTPEPDLFKRPPGSSGTLCNGGTALVVDIAGVARRAHSFTRRGRPVPLAPGHEDAHRRLSDRSPGSGTSWARTRLEQSRARSPGYGNAVAGRSQKI